MTMTAYPGSSTNQGGNDRPRIMRQFTTPGVDPYDLITWEKRSATISDESGKSFFEQNDIEVPSSWSMTATNVVASKYFRGKLGSPQRETSVRQLIDRIVSVMTAWGRQPAMPEASAPYFADEAAALTFAAELTHILVNQYASFNSPVWFNVGVKEKPQCSACFILSVQDDMESILDWCRTEGMIFKGGSGSGINLSNIRSSKEHLSGGGVASGPVSFMRGADAIAGSIKSGGTTRRAAKMVILNADHPDVMDFIESKAREEKKAYALGDAGWDMSLNGEAWASVQFQNANNSVRATDEFMDAAIDGRSWDLHGVSTGGDVVETLNARDVLRAISQAAWECGDPGMQFDTVINDWHTCSTTGRINGSNPCSEYMHLDNSACNLASINLLKFLSEENGQMIFDVAAFQHTVDIVITAQEIVVGHSGYPTPEIERNAHAFRQLGLGYANLGALLMSLGVPYDSESGRSYAAAITALMTGRAYAQSALVASTVGTFAGYAENRDPMLRVIGKHREAAYAIEDGVITDSTLIAAARTAWDEALELGKRHGYRNAQASVLAPTGTIAFMMDCDTTGVEPDIALIKYKKLVGGGMLRIVNQTVPRALRRLGYSEDQIGAIVAYIDQTGTIEGAPELQDKDLPVFDCAFRAENGVRSILPMGHVKMMGAIQPFISGAISKTVNLPTEATVDDVMDTYVESWRAGVKAIAIYRDGSKRTQPVSTSSGTKTKAAAAVEAKPVRRRMPDTRKSITHKFSIEGHEGYITVGMFDDGQPGEVFVSIAKQGSTTAGLCEAFGRAISYTLQYGVPLRDMVQRFSYMRFEPMGRTENREIPVAQSIVDYIFRWLASQFLSEVEKTELGILTPTERARLEAQYSGVQPELIAAPVVPLAAIQPQPSGEGPMVYHGPRVQADAPACANCGWIMSRAGTCYRCENCGSTSGCS